MSSLVPGYMAVSWTVSPPAVGVRVTCGVEGRPEGEGEGIMNACQGAWNYLHKLTEERPDCSVDPHCSKYVGQSDVEGVLCAGLQSHDVEETAISHNLVGRVEGAVNEDLHLYGRALWKLHTRTAHWDVSRVQFGESDIGRGYKGEEGQREGNEY